LQHRLDVDLRGEATQALAHAQLGTREPARERLGIAARDRFEVHVEIRGHVWT
jgi:hypothetical protein